MDHDESSDLHAFLDLPDSLIHPHTQEGYAYLAVRLPIEMDRYEEDEGTENPYSPTVSPETLLALVEEAEMIGLTVQKQRSKNYPIDTHEEN